MNTPWDNACSSYRPGAGWCADGFPQNAGCLGLACSTCGRPSDKVPACMNENLGLPWVDPDTGNPVHAPMS